MLLQMLDNWETTLNGLHQGACLLGIVQRLAQEPRPAYLELGLAVEPQGLFTGRLPAGGRVFLDFSSGCLGFAASGGGRTAFPLNGKTPAELFYSLFSFLEEGELREVLPAGQDLFDRIQVGIQASGERYHPLRRAHLLDGTQLEINPKTARDYWAILQGTIFTGLARAKARLLGLQTPLVVWPHGFDLSTLWFAGNEIDESQFHMNFGFPRAARGTTIPTCMRTPTRIPLISSRQNCPPGRFGKHTAGGAPCCPTT